MDQHTQKKSSILRFFPFTKGFRGKFLLAFLMVIVAVVANYMTPQVIRVTVDSVINDTPFNLPAFLVEWIESIGGREMLRQHIVICAAVSLVFAVIAGLSNYSSRMSLARACEGTVARVRDTLFAHIQRLPYAWHNSHQTGDIIQRCTQDVELIRNFVSDQLMEVVRTVLLIVVSLAMMFSLNRELSLLVCCFVPVLMVSNLVFFVITGKKFQAADESEGRLTAFVQENLTGVRVVRAFGRERYEIDRFNEKNEEFTNYWVRLSTVMGFNWGLGDFLAGFQVLVILVAGVFFVERGALTEGEFLAFTAYNSMLVWPSRNLGRLLAELGLPENALDEVPLCPLCGDTGYRNGEMCQCLRKYCDREQQRELSRMLDLGSQSFDTFDLSWYSDRLEPGQRKSARQHMEERVYNCCAEYASHFGRRPENLLLFGAPGLGKTHLSAAIAREVSERGFSVVYDTAGSVFEQFEDRKFGREEDAAPEVERVLRSDLLILDDLGSEMTTAFVQSALYRIVNTRLAERRSTIISTNLTPEGIAQRYTPQIASRIEGEYTLLPFVGEDIRKLKKERPAR